MDGQYTLGQLGQKIKAKYPAYKDMDDNEVGQQVLQKYPQYQKGLIKEDSPTPQSPEEKSLGGFAKNVGTSGMNLLGGLFDAGKNVFNPNIEENTVANIARIPIGVGEKIGQTITGRENYSSGNTQRVDALTNFYKERYGGVDKVKETAYQDPVGVLTDLATLLSAGGTGVAKVGQVAKASKVANVGTKVAAVGKTLDPINQLLKIPAGITTKPVAGVTKAIEKTGDVLQTEAKKVPLAGVRITPPQLKKFKDENGVAVEDFIKKEKLTGNPVERGIEKAEELQDLYDNAVMKSGKKVTREEIIGGFDKQIADLTSGDNAFIPEAQAMAQKLQQKRDTFITAMGENSELGVEQVVRIRRQTDKLIPKNGFMADPIDAGVSTQTRRILNDIVYNKVDDTKIDGLSPRETGKRLKQYHDFNEYASKTNLPTGRSLLTDKATMSQGGSALLALLTGNPSLAATLFGGSIATKFGDKLISNPTVLNAGSKATEGAGKVISTTGKAVNRAIKPTDDGLQALQRMLQRLNDTTRNTGVRALGTQDE